MTQEEVSQQKAALEELAREDWKRAAATQDFRAELEVQYRETLEKFIRFSGVEEPKLHKLVQLGVQARTLQELINKLCPKQH